MHFSIESNKAVLSTLYRISENMPVDSKALWQSRISHVYGDMKGQRAVDLAAVSKSLELDISRDNGMGMIIALESYFFLLCNLVAYASFQKDPCQFLRQLHFYPPRRFRSFLDRLVSGALFEDEGIYGCRSAFDFEWIGEECGTDNLLTIRDALSSLTNLWDQDQLRIPGIDPLQAIHRSLFPKNLLHITGQFYTPEWLAELLLSDIDWSPTERLIDPFCGSGVFLICALERARLQGAMIDDVLPNLLGIDLNPIACAAARSNLALYIGRQRPKLTAAVHLNIISADSLAPAITKGQSKQSPMNLWHSVINIDGKTIDLPDLSSHTVVSQIASRLTEYGLSLDNWIDSSSHLKEQRAPEKLSARDRRIWEQFFVYAILPAEVVITNPPWVGWEYISRPYRDTMAPAWRLYDLFKVRGLDAAFLKEDLSSLALMVAWDYFLAANGKSAVVLRPATMHSDLAARGVRRLSLADDGAPLNLQHVRTFSDVRVFQGANTDVATWEIKKGEPTTFPVKVTEWSKNSKRWKLEPSMSLDTVKSHMCDTLKHATRTDPHNPASRWLIGYPNSIESLTPLQGSNDFVPRIGVFTGGANAVFYLQYLGPGNTGETSLYRNIIEGTKRTAPSRTTFLEHAVVFSVLRGRDIQMWHAQPEVSLLCMHTCDTRMYPLEEQLLAGAYPLAYEYLLSMRSVLTERKGFAGWEKKVLEKYFYTLQRIGEYTFSPYKVCWKYIASEFTVCVVDGDDYSKPILPNDKVIFVPFESLQAAYFLCGTLSSTPIRNYINSSVSKRQISTNVIKTLAIPQYDVLNTLHVEISSTCMHGHLATSNNDAEQLKILREQLDVQVGLLFGL